jgi:hypothetical protein
VLWVLRDTTTPEQRLQMLKGLAYVCMESRDVRFGDYGTDLFGGTQPLRDVKPWLRTPRWRSQDAPPANYDVAIHFDFDDFAGHDAYGADPVHNAASDFNATVADDELTARVDWWYEGPWLSRRGHVRHAAMFVWADGATEQARQAALDALRRLEDAPGVEQVTTGQNVGRLKQDFDWILDVQVPDAETAKRLLESDLYADVMRTVAAATRFEWTARLSHVMRGR